ncbi:MAG: toll/interleukin-1 receptor domain-containing protein [Clostridia bacterium]|nr:toll/interleukin-1 receptor domain-containing protein [Clostridia bacterium]
MKEVFISYSTVDAANAETVRNVLEKNGLSCWMAPRDIPGGSNYTREIPIAIRNCKVFVLILSKNAQSSQWVLKELDSAVNCGKVILPFMLEECILNDEFNFLLTGAQRYAAYQKKAEAMETLISRIRGIIDAPSASVAESESVAVLTEEQKPEKSSKKAAPVYLGETVCPACGSDELTLLPKRVKRSGVAELSTMLLIPALAIAGLFVFFILSTFIIPYDMFGLVVLFTLVGAVVGGVLGNIISKNIVKRNRIRRHLPNTCYKCKSCSKVFLGEDQ